MLARWSGWGAVPQVFDEHLDTYAAARTELRELLTKDGFDAASRTVLNAHYTDGALVAVMWQALQRLGLGDGDVLEPGCGAGHFIGMAPPGARMVGVERDPTSAGIAALLYPHARVVAGSFADLDADEGSFDAAVGNVPFGSFRVHDPRHNPARHSIHNHFLIKALHLTRPGGLVVALTSRYTLDARNPAARREMAELADLVGAVRLPTNAHRRAAGTAVVTDLLILRRREPDQPPSDLESWEFAVPHSIPNTNDVKGAAANGTDDDGAEANGTDTMMSINQYFVEHPDHVLGEFRAKFVPDRGTDLEVLGDPDAAPALEAALERIIDQAHERGHTLTPPTGPRTTRSAAETDLIDPDAALYAGFLAAKPDGTFTRRVGREEHPYNPPPAQAEELRGLLGIRDLAMALITAENTTIDDTAEVRDLRAKLNGAYDTYVATYGPPSRYTQTRTMIAGSLVFKRWCADNPAGVEHESLPASPDTVRAYLTHLRDAGVGADILKKHLNGIDKAHETAHGKQVEKVLDVIARGRDATARVRAAQVAEDYPDQFLVTTGTADVRLGSAAFLAGREVIAAAEKETPEEVDLDELGLRTATIQRPPQGGFRGDPFAGVVRSLEVFDPASGEARKEDILTQRVINPPRPRLGADTAEEALSICLDTHSRVDLDEIARLLGLTDTATARAELGELVFDDPDTDEVVWAPLYLSGNVRRKLARAHEAAEADGRFAVNVTALEQVVPADLGPSDVVVQLGAWVEPAYVQQFLRELVQDQKVRVERPLPSLWVVSSREFTYAATDVWGTGHVDAYELVESLLLGDTIEVFDAYEITRSDGSTGTRKVLNVEATEMARDKAAAIGHRFSAWVFEDPERAAALMRRYNELFNSEIPTDFSTAELSTPGLAASIVLREHQIAAVSRMIYQNGVGLIHDVGAGKTLEIIAGVMERRRRGLSTKTVIVVRNDSIGEQFERQWRSAYPGAQVLVATSDDFTVKKGVDKRAEFVARVTASSWDAIIITKDSFQRIPLSADTQREFIGRELDDIRELRRQKDEADLSKTAAKKTEQALAKAEERLTLRLENLTRDTAGVSFEQTGVDLVVVDEAQDFKNGLVVSRLPDLGILGSDRAIDLDLKLLWLAERYQHSCAVLATATPFTGKFSEIYLWLRRLGHDLTAFDEWARNFIIAENYTEPTPSGQLRPKMRMRRMLNEDDLWAILRLTSDVKMADALNIPGLPQLREGGVEIIAVDASAEAKIHSLELGRRDRAIRNDPRKPEKGADNHLVINHHGMQAALDLRIRGVSTDEPQKVDVIAEDIYAEHLAGADNVYRAADGSAHPVRGGLILAFCDESIPRPGWNFYQELKDQLVTRGMREGSIRFIHEATTAQAKQDLYTACRNGGVSVLIGSTARMGAGLNVQDRLLGGYEIIPPRDYRADTSHQARGRVIRQGNQNEIVFWKRVVLAPSLDAKKWEIVRQKHNLFAPLLAAQKPGRHRDVNDDESIDLADVMAAATGDPRYTEKAELDAEFKKLTRLQAGHTRAQQAARLLVGAIEKKLPRLRREREEAEQVATRHVSTRGAAFSMIVAGDTVTKRIDAAHQLNALLRNEMAATPRTQDGRDITVATLGGFTITAQLRPMNQQRTIHLLFADAGAYTYVAVDHRDLPEGFGLITRLENMLDEIPKRPNLLRSQIEDAETTLTQARTQIDALFPHTARLAEVTTRRTELTAELSEEDDTTLDAAVDPNSPAGKARAARLEKRAKERAELAEQVRLTIFEAGGDDPHTFADWYVAIVEGIPVGQRPSVLTAHKVWRELGRPNTITRSADTANGDTTIGPAGNGGSDGTRSPALEVAPELAWLADAAMVSTVATRWPTIEDAVEHLRQVEPLPFYRHTRQEWEAHHHTLVEEITTARKTHRSPAGALIAYKAKSPHTERQAWYVVHTASGAQFGDLITHKTFDIASASRDAVGAAITLPDAMMPRYLYALEHRTDADGQRLDWTQDFAGLRTALAEWTTPLPVDTVGRFRDADQPPESAGVRTLHALAVLDATAPDPLAAALTGELVRITRWVFPTTAHSVALAVGQRSVAPLRKALDVAFAERYQPDSGEDKALLAVDDDISRVLITTALWGFGADPPQAIDLLTARIDTVHNLHNPEFTLAANRLRELVLHIAELHTPEPTELERLLHATSGSRLVAAPPPDSSTTQPETTWKITGPSEPVDGTHGGPAARLPVTLHRDAGLVHGTLIVDPAAQHPVVIAYHRDQPDGANVRVPAELHLPALAAGRWMVAAPDQPLPAAVDEIRHQSHRAAHAYLYLTQTTDQPTDQIATHQAGDSPTASDPTVDATGTDLMSPPTASASTEQPSPGAASTPDTATAPAPIVSGHWSSEPLLDNTWGAFEPTAPVAYHDDGPIGIAVHTMAGDAHMDIDGEPLANLLGRVATDVVVGRCTAQEGLDIVKAILERLPHTSRAYAALDRAVQDMDAPDTPLPELPATTLEPLRTLVEALHAVPIVRADPNTELIPLLTLLDQFANGGIGGGRLIDAVRGLTDRRHESLGDSGKFEIDRAIRTAVTALDELPRTTLTPPRAAPPAPEHQLPNGDQHPVTVSPPPPPRPHTEAIAAGNEPAVDEPVVDASPTTANVSEPRGRPVDERTVPPPTSQPEDLDHGHQTHLSTTDRATTDRASTDQEPAGQPVDSELTDTNAPEQPQPGWPTGLADTSGEPKVHSGLRILTLHFSQQHGVLLLGTDKTDDLGPLLKQQRSGWKHSHRITGPHGEIGAWYVPKTHQQNRQGTKLRDFHRRIDDRITQAGQALVQRGFTLRLDLHDLPDQTIQDLQDWHQAAQPTAEESRQGAALTARVASAINHTRTRIGHLADQVPDPVLRQAWTDFAGERLIHGTRPRDLAARRQVLLATLPDSASPAEERMLRVVRAVLADELAASTVPEDLRDQFRAEGATEEDVAEVVGGIAGYATALLDRISDTDEIGRHLAATDAVAVVDALVAIAHTIADVHHIDRPENFPPRSVISAITQPPHPPMTSHEITAITGLPHWLVRSATPEDGAAHTLAGQQRILWGYSAAEAAVLRQLQLGLISVDQAGEVLTRTRSHDPSVFGSDHVRLPVRIGQRTGEITEFQVDLSGHVLLRGTASDGEALLVRADPRTRWNPVTGVLNPPPDRPVQLIHGGADQLVTDRDAATVTMPDTVTGSGMDSVDAATESAPAAGEVVDAYGVTPEHPVVGYVRESVARLPHDPNPEWAVVDRYRVAAAAIDLYVVNPQGSGVGWPLSTIGRHDGPAESVIPRSVELRPAVEWPHWIRSLRQSTTILRAARGLEELADRVTGVADLLARRMDALPTTPAAFQAQTGAAGVRLLPADHPAAPALARQLDRALHSQRVTGERHDTRGPLKLAIEVLGEPEQSAEELAERACYGTPHSLLRWWPTVTELRDLADVVETAGYTIPVPGREVSAPELWRAVADGVAARLTDRPHHEPQVPVEVPEMVPTQPRALYAGEKTTPVDRLLDAISHGTAHREDAEHTRMAASTATDVAHPMLADLDAADPDRVQQATAALRQGVHDEALLHLAWALDGRHPAGRRGVREAWDVLYQLLWPEPGWDLARVARRMITWASHDPAQLAGALVALATAWRTRVETGDDLARLLAEPLVAAIADQLESVADYLATHWEFTRPTLPRIRAEQASLFDLDPGHTAKTTTEKKPSTRTRPHANTGSTRPGPERAPSAPAKTSQAAPDDTPSVGDTPRAGSDAAPPNLVGGPAQQASQQTHDATPTIPELSTAVPDTTPDVVVGAVGETASGALTLRGLRAIAAEHDLHVRVVRVADAAFVTVHEPAALTPPVLSWPVGATEVIDGAGHPMPAEHVGEYLARYRSVVEPGLVAAATGVEDWARRVAYLTPHLLPPLGQQADQQTWQQGEIRRLLDEAVNLAGEDRAQAENRLRGAEILAGSVILTPEREAQIVREIHDHASGYGWAGDVGRYLTAPGHLDGSWREWEWINTYVRDHPAVLDGHPDHNGIQARTTAELAAQKQAGDDLLREAAAAHRAGAFDQALDLLDQADLANPADAARWARARARVHQKRAQTPTSPTIPDRSIPNPAADLAVSAEQPAAPEVPDTPIDTQIRREPHQPEPAHTRPVQIGPTSARPDIGVGPGSAMEVSRERGVEVFEAAVTEAHQALAEIAASDGYKPEAWHRFYELIRTDPRTGVGYSATQPERQTVSLWWIQQASSALGELGYRVELRHAEGQRRYRDHQIEVDHAAKLVIVDASQFVGTNAFNLVQQVAALRAAASDTPVQDRTAVLNTVRSGPSTSPDEIAPDLDLAVSAADTTEDAVGGRAAEDMGDGAVAPDQPATTDSAEPSVDELYEAEGYPLIPGLTGVSELFRAHHWDLVEVQPVEDVGTYTEHWRRRDVSVAVSITPEDRVLTRLFIRHGPWESDAWQEIETESAHHVRALAEQAGLHGVARPARLPGLWRVEAFAFAADAATARNDTTPQWRLVTRPAAGSVHEHAVENDEAGWVFDDGTPVPLAPPLPQVTVASREDVIKYVLGDQHRDKDLRRAVLVVLSGRANRGLYLGDARRQLAAAEPEIYRRAVTAAVGRPQRKGEQFDVARARDALERLAEGDPALPLNSIGHYVEITEPDLEAEQVPLVGPMPTRLVRGVVVKVTPNLGTQLRVVIDRDVTDVTGAPRALQDVPIDGVLTWLDPTERPSAEELRAAREAIVPAIREHEQQLGLHTIGRDSTASVTASGPDSATDANAPQASASAVSTQQPGTSDTDTEAGGGQAESTVDTDTASDLADDMVAAALAWWDAGCSVVMVETDGSKRPLPHQWAPFQRERATREQVAAWFATGHPGVGVVTGAVSGGLEMFEFEGRAMDEFFYQKLRARMRDLGHQDLWDRVMEGYDETSPSGGIHVLYRVEGGVDRNVKLAQREALDDELTDEEQFDLRKTARRARRTLIETRGEGGFVVVAPSHGGVHASGGAWETITGDPSTIPTITAAERDILHMAARDLDQIPAPPPIPEPAPRAAQDGEGLRPGDEFNQRASWAQVLDPHGWVPVGGDSTRTFWRRPGKDHGVSAVTGGDRGDYLWVFSTSTALPSEQALSKWRTYGLLDHAGDFSAAARALAEAGYGDRASRAPTGPRLSASGRERSSRSRTADGRHRDRPAPDTNDNNPTTTAPSTSDQASSVDAATSSPRPGPGSRIPRVLTTAAPPAPADAATITSHGDIHTRSDLTSILRAYHNGYQSGWLPLTSLIDETSSGNGTGHQLPVATQSLAQVREATRRLWPVATAYGLGLEVALDLDTLADAAGAGVIVHLPRLDTLDRDTTAVVAALAGFRADPDPIPDTTPIAGAVSHRHTSPTSPAEPPQQRDPAETGHTPAQDPPTTTASHADSPAPADGDTDDATSGNERAFVVAAGRAAHMLDRVDPETIQAAIRLVTEEPKDREGAMRALWAGIPIFDARLTVAVIEIVRDVVYGVTWGKHLDPDRQARDAIAAGHGLPTAINLAAVAQELHQRTGGRDPLATILHHTDTTEIVTQLYSVADRMAVHGEFVVPHRPNLLGGQTSLLDLPEPGTVVSGTGEPGTGEPGTAVIGDTGRVNQSVPSAEPVPVSSTRREGSAHDSTMVVGAAGEPKPGSSPPPAPVVFGHALAADEGSAMGDADDVPGDPSNGAVQESEPVARYVADGPGRERGYDAVRELIREQSEDSGGPASDEGVADTTRTDESAVDGLAGVPDHTPLGQQSPEAAPIAHTPRPGDAAAPEAAVTAPDGTPHGSASKPTERDRRTSRQSTPDAHAPTPTPTVAAGNDPAARSSRQAPPSPASQRALSPAVVGLRDQLSTSHLGWPTPLDAFLVATDPFAAQDLLRAITSTTKNDPHIQVLVAMAWRAHYGQVTDAEVRVFADRLIQGDPSTVGHAVGRTIRDPRTRQLHAIHGVRAGIDGRLFLDGTVADSPTTLTSPVDPDAWLNPSGQEILPAAEAFPLLRRWNELRALTAAHGYTVYEQPDTVLLLQDERRIVIGADSLTELVTQLTTITQQVVALHGPTPTSNAAAAAITPAAGALPAPIAAGTPPAAVAGETQPPTSRSTVAATTPRRDAIEGITVVSVDDPAAEPLVDQLAMRRHTSALLLDEPARLALTYVHRILRGPVEDAEFLARTVLNVGYRGEAEQVAARLTALADKIDAAGFTTPITGGTIALTVHLRAIAHHVRARLTPDGTTPPAPGASARSTDTASTATTADGRALGGQDKAGEPGAPLTVTPSADGMPHDPAASQPSGTGHDVPDSQDPPLGTTATTRGEDREALTDTNSAARTREETSTVGVPLDRPSTSQGRGSPASPVDRFAEPPAANGLPGTVAPARTDSALGRTPTAAGAVLWPTVDLDLPRPRHPADEPPRPPQHGQPADRVTAPTGSAPASAPTQRDRDDGIVDVTVNGMAPVRSGQDSATAQWVRLVDRASHAGYAVVTSYDAPSNVDDAHRVIRIDGNQEPLARVVDLAHKIGLIEATDTAAGATGEAAHGHAPTATAGAGPVPRSPAQHQPVTRAAATSPPGRRRVAAIPAMQPAPPLPASMTPVFDSLVHELGWKPTLDGGDRLRRAVAFRPAEPQPEPSHTPVFDQLMRELGWQHHLTTTPNGNTRTDRVVTTPVTRPPTPNRTSMGNGTRNGQPDRHRPVATPARSHAHDEPAMTAGIAPGHRAHLAGGWGLETTGTTVGTTRGRTGR